MTVKNAFPPLQKKVVKPTVIKFDPTEYGIRKHKPSTEPEPNAHSPLPELEEVDSTKFDKLEDMFDKQVTDIVDMLEDIKDYNAQHLKGKERHKYLRNRVVELGAKPKKAIHVPFKRLKGERKAQQKRELKKKQSLLETGMLIKRKK